MLYFLLNLSKRNWSVWFSQLTTLETICENTKLTCHVQRSLCTFLWGLRRALMNVREWISCSYDYTRSSAPSRLCCVHILAALHDGSVANVPCITWIHRSCCEWWISQGSTVCQRTTSEIHWQDNYSGQLFSDWAKRELCEFLNSD